MIRSQRSKEKKPQKARKKQKGTLNTFASVITLVKDHAIQAEDRVGLHIRE